MPNAIYMQNYYKSSRLWYIGAKIICFVIRKNYIGMYQQAYKLCWADYIASL